MQRVAIKISPKCKILLHIMMYFEGEDVRFGLGDGTEKLCLRITADSEGDLLRQKMPCFCRTEPVRLRRLPVDEVEIGVLGMDRRRAFRLLVLQFAKNEGTITFALRCP